jgi:hypothetical protein
VTTPRKILKLIIHLGTETFETKIMEAIHMGRFSKVKFDQFKNVLMSRYQIEFIKTRQPGYSVYFSNYKKGKRWMMVDVEDRYGDADRLLIVVDCYRHDFAEQELLQLLSIPHRGFKVGDTTNYFHINNNRDAVHLVFYGDYDFQNAGFLDFLEKAEKSFWKRVRKHVK